MEQNRAPVRRSRRPPPHRSHVRSMPQFYPSKPPDVTDNPRQYRDPRLSRPAPRKVEPPGSPRNAANAPDRPRHAPAATQPPARHTRPPTVWKKGGEYISMPGVRSSGGRGTGWGVGVSKSSEYGVLTIADREDVDMEQQAECQQCGRETLRRVWDVPDPGRRSRADAPSEYRCTNPACGHVTKDPYK